MSTSLSHTHTHTSLLRPFWLSPTQVMIVPVSAKFDDYAKEVSLYIPLYWYILYSGTSLIRTPMGQKKVSLLVRRQRLKKCMQEWYLGLERCPV